ncbi:hypothetical protein WJX77_010344 [Trebouxia sp. C0004]
MDTSNKIRVVEQDTLRMKRRESGGVREPSDPKHYPTIGGIEGAVGTSNSQRTFSPLGSFKETLVSRPDIPKLQIGTAGSSGTSPSFSPTELQKTSLGTADMTGAHATTSPKITANRSVQGDGPVQGGVGGAGSVGSSTPSQQAGTRLDSQEDGFAPPSPKKVVTQAAQRRKTADEQAREERFHQGLAHPNTFAALADDSFSHVGEELSQEPLAKADNREEPGQDSAASSQSRSRWGLAWSKTLGVVAVVKEHPVTTTLVVTAITIGFMMSTRRRNFHFVPT